MEKISRIITQIPSIFVLLSVLGIFIGIFLWVDVFRNLSDLACLAGFIIFFCSFSYLCFFSLVKEAFDESLLFGILSVAASIALVVSVFCFFAFFDVVPLLPRQSWYGYVALPLMLAGGGGDAAIVIIIKV